MLRLIRKVWLLLVYLFLNAPSQSFQDKVKSQKDPTAKGNISNNKGKSKCTTTSNPFATNTKASILHMKDVSNRMVNFSSCAPKF